MFEYFAPNWWRYFGSFKRCGLDGGQMSLGEVFEVSKASNHSQYTFLLEFFTVQDVIFQFPVSGTTIPVLNYYKLQHSETETSLQ